MIRSLTVLAGAAAVAAVVHAPPASAKELAYGTFVAAQAIENRVALKAYFDGVTRDTGGEITWKFLPGGQVVTGRGTLSAIRDQVIDAGFVVPTFTSRELAATNVVYDSLFKGTDTLAVSGASVETVMLNCPQCIEEFRRHNAVYLTGISVPAMKLMCRGEPPRTVADLAGVRVRSSAAAYSRWVTRLGGVPVTMSGPEGAPAMQRGAVDCATASASWLVTFGYLDMTKSMLDFTFGSPRAVGLVVMNRAVWNGLTEEQKTIMLRNGARAQALATIGYIDLDVQMMKKAKEAGITIVEGGDDFKAQLEQHLQEEPRVLAEEARNFGVRDPEAIIAAFDRNLEKWQALAAEIGDDVDKLTDALWENIYAKVDLGRL